MNLYVSLVFSLCLMVYLMVMGVNNKAMHTHQTDEHSLRWYESADSQRIQGVCLVVHGLNLVPQRMESICKVLQRAGMDALLVSLQGHGENYRRRDGLAPAEARMKSFQEVTLGQWRSEVKQAYEIVVQRSRERGVPLYYIGFSLVGLLGPELLKADEKVQFDKMVLFAPALRIRPFAHILKLLFLFPGLVIPSKSPETYRSNRGTPIGAYNAMFSALRNFHNNELERIDIPTLVFLDRDDEFVPYAGIERFMNRHELERWNLLPVEKDPALAGEWNHHLIIDKQVVGAKEWQRIIRRMLGHLRTD